MSTVLVPALPVMDLSSMNQRTGRQHPPPASIRMCCGPHLLCLLGQINTFSSAWWHGSFLSSSFHSCKKTLREPGSCYLNKEPCYSLQCFFHELEELRGRDFFFLSLWPEDSTGSFPSPLPPMRNTQSTHQKSSPLLAQPSQQGHHNSHRW